MRRRKTVRRGKKLGKERWVEEEKVRKVKIVEEEEWLGKVK